MSKRVRFWITRNDRDIDFRMFWTSFQPVPLTDVDNSIIRDMGAIGMVDQERCVQFCEYMKRRDMDGTLAHLWGVRKADMGRIQRDAIVSILHKKLAGISAWYDGGDDVVKIDLSGHIGGFGNEPVE